MKKFDYLILMLFVLLLYIVHIYFDLNNVMDIMKNSGRLAPIIFIFIYTLVLLLMLPILPLTIIGAIVFGGFLGSFYNTIACTLGLIISYGITKSKISIPLLKKLEKIKFFNTIKKDINKNFIKTILITRCAPIFSYGIQNYIYGFIKVNFMPYFIVSTISTYIMNLLYATGFSKIFENKKIEHSLLILVLLLTLMKGVNYLYIKKSKNWKNKN